MSQTLKPYLVKLEFALLCGIVFTLPLHKKLIPWVIATYVFVFLINGGLKKIAQSINKKYLMITSGYYIFLLIGILYSDVQAAAFFDVEVKFSLLLFPFIFSAIKLNTKQFSELFLWFILGCLVATLFCVATAVSYYFNTSDASVFYYQQLSVFQHPSYFSLYLNFCIYFIYYYMVFNKDNFRIKHDLISVLIILIFSLFVVLLSSKIGLITLFMVIFIGTLLWFLKSRALFPSIMVFFMLSTMIYFSFKHSNQIQGRLQEAVNSISTEKVNYTTTGARMLIWKCGLELFLESPVVGYGTGDVKHELMKKYNKYDYTYLEEAELNAHNQYVQTLIAIGLFGGVFFFAYMFYPVFDKRFFTNMIYMGFLILIVLNFLTESMLETQAGVVFYAFFNALLFFNQEKIVPIKFKLT